MYTIKVALLVLASCLGTTCSGQTATALSEYIYKSGWTPAVDHSTDFVPGAIISVNRRTGAWELLPLSPEQRSLLLENATAQFDQGETATFNSGSAAVAGLSTLFGGGVSGGFQSNSSVSFSGVTLDVNELAFGQEDRMFRNHTATTYITVRDYYANPHRPALFLITKVGWASAAEVSSTRDIGGGVGLGAVDRGQCVAGKLPAPTLPPSQPQSTNQNQAGDAGTTPTTQQGQDKPKTVADAVDQQKRTSTQTANVQFCHDKPGHVRYFSAKPLPVAAKLKFIKSLQNGLVETDISETRLSLYDPRLTKRQATDAERGAYR